MDPQQLAQYMQLLQQYSNDPNSAGLVQYNTTAPQDALNTFRNTPAYQLQYGTNANYSNPALNFQSDPGVQLAISQGSQALMNNYAARGLGQSGAAANALTQYMYNNYKDYTGGQASLFNNYQNQLAGLASMGANTATNLGNQAAQAGSTIGTGQSNNFLSTGSNIASGNLATGSNVSSLLGNQGVLNAGAYLNTGAAQANNLFNGATLQAQLNANQAASNAQTQNSLLSGQGAMNQAQTLNGGRF